VAETVRPLRPSDDRTSFRCSDARINEYLAKYAGQSQFKQRSVVTYVIERDSQIASYVTVTGGTVAAERVPRDQGRFSGSFPLPVLVLARMGTDERYLGQKLAFELVGYVLGLALTLSDEIGCIGVLVDAKPGVVGFYKDKFGFMPTVEPWETKPGDPTPMFLSTKRIIAAVKD
jgi:hypothetical protein